MKFIVLILAVVCITVAHSACEGNGNTYDDLLIIANNDIAEAKKHLSNIQEQYSKMVEKMQQGAVNLINEMQSGPAECNKASDVQDYINSRKQFLDAQSKRDIVSEIKAKPKMAALFEEMSKNQKDITNIISACSAPCNVDEKVLCNIKGAVNSVRSTLQEAFKAEEVSYANDLLQKDDFLTYVKEFLDCLQSQSVTTTTRI